MNKEFAVIVMAVLFGMVIITLLSVAGNEMGLTAYLPQEKVGDFICKSHGLGEYKKHFFAEGQIIWVSCEKKVEQSETKIRGYGIEQ